MTEYLSWHQHAKDSDDRCSVPGPTSATRILLERRLRLPYDVAASEQCGAILVGALRRELRNRCSVSPQDKAPYSGASFTALRSTLQNIKNPTWYTSKHSHNHPRALRPEINKRVEAEYEVVVGSGSYLTDFDRFFRS
jgi:hypothetical protein